MVENNGGQKVCIIAWQFSAFNLPGNRCPHSELSYSTNLHRLIPNVSNFFKKNLLPHFDHLGKFYISFVLLQKCECSSPVLIH